MRRPQWMIRSCRFGIPNNRFFRFADLQNRSFPGMCRNRILRRNHHMTMTIEHQTRLSSKHTQNPSPHPKPKHCLNCDSVPIVCFYRLRVPPYEWLWCTHSVVQCQRLASFQNSCEHLFDWMGKMPRIAQNMGYMWNFQSFCKIVKCLSNSSENRSPRHALPSIISMMPS